MPTSKPEYISVVSFSSEETDQSHSMFPLVNRLTAKYSQISIETINRSLEDFLEVLEKAARNIPSACGSYDIDSLSFSLSLDGNGKISLIGEISAGVASSITLTLKKRRD